jgi:hypothetical protein
VGHPYAGGVVGGVRVNVLDSMGKTACPYPIAVKGVVAVKKRDGIYFEIGAVHLP